jgi:hypothetical protein
MTLPDERYNSVLRTRQFLRELCDPKQTPRVPKDIRQQARWCLRHYPDTWEMQTTARLAPEVFQERIEDVKRMIMVYEEGKKNEA